MPTLFHDGRALGEMQVIGVRTQTEEAEPVPRGFDAAWRPLSWLSRAG